MASTTNADDRHPQIDTKFYVAVGGLFADRKVKASADGSVEPEFPVQYIDFETGVAVDDSPQMFLIELQWQYSKNWNLGLQYFGATRAVERTLESTIEWDGVTYEIGADVRARTKVDITRVVFSRNFRYENGHDIKLGAGLHWLDVSAQISGDATLDNGSTVFTVSQKSASLPIPNIGGAYRFSPSDKWLLSLRVDWFSASLDDYSGGIWNAMANVNYRLTNHFGAGIGYQFFQIDGALSEDRWNGDLKVRFHGPFLQVSGFW